MISGIGDRLGKCHVGLTPSGPVDGGGPTRRVQILGRGHVLQGGFVCHGPSECIRACPCSHGVRRARNVGARRSSTESARNANRGACGYGFFTRRARCEPDARSRFRALLIRRILGSANKILPSRGSRRRLQIRIAADRRSRCGRTPQGSAAPLRRTLLDPI